nr:MAG TPA: hypothetical protein [Caudoviricetes sp.]
MTLLRTHIFWRPNDVRHDCFARDNVYFLIMQPSRKRLHSGGWIKKEYGDSTPLFPTVIHSHSRPIPHQSTTYLPPSHSQQFSIPLRLLTPIQPSDYHFEQTAYLRRFPHSRSTSISCYFMPILSL